MPRTPRLLRRALTLLLLTLVTAALLATAAAAQVEEGDIGDTAVQVDILPLEGFLDPPVAGAITDLVAQAAERGSALVVIQLDAAGAVSVDLEELAGVVRDSEVPVAVYVGPRGAEAELAGGAALLLGAAHIRAVASDATVGPVTPLDLGDAPDPADVSALEAVWPDLPDDVAAAMVTDGVDVQRLVDADGVDLVADGLEPLLVDLDGRTVETATGAHTLQIRRDEVGVRFHSLGLIRRLLHAATTPVFIYLLVTIGLGMLLFEVFQPGFGVAGVAGIATAAIGVFGLTVLPVTWWAVALVLLGLALFTVDTAVAGFGPITAAATASFATGSWWFYDSDVVGLPAWLVVVTTVAAFVYFVFVLTTVLRAQAGPEGVVVEDLVGKVGMVRSVLNPEGHVYVDDALWRARWTGEAKRAKVGTPIRVHGVDGPVLLVDGFDPARAGGEPPSSEATGTGDAPG